jgi:hypothetical protein
LLIADCRPLIREGGLMINTYRRFPGAAIAVIGWLLLAPCETIAQGSAGQIEGPYAMSRAAFCLA